LSLNSIAPTNLTWETIFAPPNTVPFGGIIDTDEQSIQIYAGRQTDPLTLLAILLHELGHNVDSTEYVPGYYKIKGTDTICSPLRERNADAFVVHVFRLLYKLNWLPKTLYILSTPKEKILHALNMLYLENSWKQGYSRFLRIFIRMGRLTEERKYVRSLAFNDRNRIRAFFDPNFHFTQEARARARKRARRLRKVLDYLDEKLGEYDSVDNPDS